MGISASRFVTSAAKAVEGVHFQCSAEALLHPKNAPTSRFLASPKISVPLQQLCGALLRWTAEGGRPYVSLTLAAAARAAAASAAVAAAVSCHDAAAEGAAWGVAQVDDSG